MNNRIFLDMDACMVYPKRNFADHLNRARTLARRFGVNLKLSVDCLYIMDDEDIHQYQMIDTIESVENVIIDVKTTAHFPIGENAFTEHCLKTLEKLIDNHGNVLGCCFHGPHMLQSEVLNRLVDKGLFVSLRINERQFSDRLTDFFLEFNPALTLSLDCRIDAAGARDTLELVYLHLDKISDVSLSWKGNAYSRLFANRKTRFDCSLLSFADTGAGAESGTEPAVNTESLPWGYSALTPIRNLVISGSIPPGATGELLLEKEIHWINQHQHRLPRDEPLLRMQA